MKSLFGNKDINMPMLYAGLGLLGAGYDRRVNPWQAAMQGYAAGNQQLQNQQLMGLRERQVGLEEKELERKQSQIDAGKQFLRMLTPQSESEWRAPSGQQPGGMLADPQQLIQAAAASGNSDYLKIAMGRAGLTAPEYHGSGWTDAEGNRWMLDVNRGPVRLPGKAALPQWVGEQIAEYEKDAGASNMRLRELGDLRAQFMNAKDLPSGWKGNLVEFAKAATGTEDAATLMRKKWNRVVTQQVLNSLPTGPASDRDIALARATMLGEQANPETIVGAISGMEKLERAGAAKSAFAARYMAENYGNNAGLEEAWQEYAKDKWEGWGFKPEREVTFE